MLVAANIPPARFKNVRRLLPSISRISDSGCIVHLQGRIAFMPVISQKSTRAGYRSSP